MGVVRDDLSNKVTFEQRLEEVTMDTRNFLAKAMASTKAPR